jgi:soluble lytic murein transglycosylase-like protein
LSFRPLFRRIAFAAALLASTPALAHAQIYAWHDASGHLVLSDRPKDPSAKTYAVPAANDSSFRVTRPAVVRRTTAFDALIVQNAARHALDPAFVRAVIQAESGFNPRARSNKGAMGLMQLMPETARDFGVVDAYDPGENIRGGVAYLKSLLTRYNNDPSLALAAYNAGPAAVEKYGRSVPPYRETQAYVARITSRTGSLASRQAPVKAPSGPPPTRVFRSVRMVDGREVVRYTNKATDGGEVVRAAERR